MTQDEIQAVARAICDDAGCIWDDDPNTPARLEWSRAAKAAIAALDAARGDQVARFVAHMKTRQPDEDVAECPATWGDFLQILEAEAEAWEPFNG